MSEEQILEQTTSVSGNETLDDTNQYIEAIREMKQNSVSKEAYDKLRAENKQLLDSLINGGQVNMQSVKPEVDIQALRNKLSDVDHPLSNLEYVKTAVELRDALIEKGERDPFLPFGENISPTQDDYIKAENASNVFKECIAYADGDSELFTNELQRRTIDAMPIRSRTTNRR